MLLLENITVYRNINRDELNDSLACSAKNLDRSKGYIVRKAIKYYLQEMQEDMEDAIKLLYKELMLLILKLILLTKLGNG